MPCNASYQILWANSPLSLPPLHPLSLLEEGGWVGNNERHLCCCPKQLFCLAILPTPAVCLTRNLPDQYLWTACNLLSSYHSISRGPMSCVLNIKDLYTPKMETVLSSETFITSYQMTASQPEDISQKSWFVPHWSKYICVNQWIFFLWYL